MAVFSWPTDIAARHAIVKQWVQSLRSGALGVFIAGSPGVVYAPIELKGAKQDLDREMARGYTPVQQGFRYANENPDCHWVIVSNYRETRVFNVNKTPQSYERFLLEDLDDEAEFKRFFFVLCRDNFLPASLDHKSAIAGLLEESAAGLARLRQEFEEHAPPRMPTVR